MSYVNYPQVEDLLKNYTALIAKMKLLKLEYEKTLLLAVAEPNNPFTEEEILYTRYIGNHVLSDMPHAMPNPGDKVLNAIHAKDKIIEEGPSKGFKPILRDLRDSIHTIGEVTEKLEIARKGLSQQEQDLLEMFYYKNMTWKEIEEKRRFVVQLSQVKNIRRDAITAMVNLLNERKAHITIEQYQFCMELLTEGGKEECEK